MYKEHPVFEAPENEDQLIWRYLDFTKYVSMLDQSSLFFSRIDRLGDPFEGSSPKLNVELRPRVFESIPGDIIKIVANLHRVLTKHTFVNCWNMDEHESAALWKLYLKSNEGIAIRSTFKKLRDSIDDANHTVFIGKINYIDYETEMIPEVNTFYPFVYKRKSFQHENELRALINDLSFIQKPNWEDSQGSELGNGTNIHIDLNKLIEAIYLAPTAPEWMLDLIKSVTNLYKLDKPINQSNLDSSPVY